MAQPKKRTAQNEWEKETCAKQKIMIRDHMRRKHGFKIHAREGDKEPIWTREGRLFVQSLVDRIVTEALLAK